MGATEIAEPPPPPPGFTLDSSAANSAPTSLPPPPPGFTLDSQPAAAPASNQPSPDGDNSAAPPSPAPQENIFLRNLHAAYGGLSQSLAAMATPLLNLEERIIAPNEKDPFGHPVHSSASDLAAQAAQQTLQNAGPNTTIGKVVGESAPLIAGSLVNPFYGAAIGANQGVGSAMNEGSAAGYSGKQTAELATERGVFNALLGLVPGGKASGVVLKDLLKGTLQAAGLNVTGAAADNAVKRAAGVKTESMWQAIKDAATSGEGWAQALLMGGIHSAMGQLTHAMGPQTEGQPTPEAAPPQGGPARPPEAQRSPISPADRASEAGNGGGGIPDTPDNSVAAQMRQALAKTAAAHAELADMMRRAAEPVPAPEPAMPNGEQPGTTLAQQVAKVVPPEEATQARRTVAEKGVQDTRTEDTGPPSPRSVAEGRAIGLNDADAQAYANGDLNPVLSRPQRQALATFRQTSPEYRAYQDFKSQTPEGLAKAQRAEGVAKEQAIQDRAQEIIPDRFEAADADIKSRGGKLLKESDSGSRYYQMPDGSQVRVADHAPNEATDQWMDRNGVEDRRVDLEALRQARNEAQKKARATGVQSVRSVEREASPEDSGQAQSTPASPQVKELQRAPDETPQITKVGPQDGEIGKTVSEIKTRMARRAEIAARVAKLPEGTLIHGTSLEALPKIAAEGVQPGDTYAQGGTSDESTVYGSRVSHGDAGVAPSYAGRGHGTTPVILELKPEVESKSTGPGAVSLNSPGKSYIRPSDIAAVHIAGHPPMSLEEAVRLSGAREASEGEAKAPWKNGKFAEQTEEVPVADLKAMLTAKPRSASAAAMSAAAKDADRVEQVREDISGNGMEHPVTLRVNGNTGTVKDIDGAHRILAAEAEGWEKVPVRIENTVPESMGGKELRPSEVLAGPGAASVNDPNFSKRIPTLAEQRAEMKGQRAGAKAGEKLGAAKEQNRQTTAAQDTGATVPLAKAIKARMQAEDRSFVQGRKAEGRQQEITEAIEQPTVTMAQAIKARMKAKDEGFVEGQKNQKRQQEITEALGPEKITMGRAIKVGMEIRAKAEQAMRKLNEKADLGQDVRDQIAGFAGELPRELRAAFLPDVAGAKTPADLRAALKKMDTNIEKFNQRNAANALMDRIGGREKATGEKPDRSVMNRINQITGVNRKPESKFSTENVAPSEMSPHYRDALSPLVESLKKDATIKGASDLADFIQKETDEGRSNAFTPEELGRVKALEGKPLRGGDAPNADDTKLLDNAIRHVTRLNEQWVQDGKNWRNRELGQRQTRIVDQVRDAHTKDLQPFGSRSGDKGVTRRIAGDLQRDTARLTAAAGGGRESELAKLGYDDLVEGENKASDVRLAGRQVMQDAEDANKWTDGRIVKMSNVPERIDLGRIEGDENPEARAAIFLTPMERVKFAQQWADPETRKLMLKGVPIIPERFLGDKRQNVRVTQGIADAILERMPPEEKAYARALSGFVNGRLRDEGNATSVREVGYERLTNENYDPRRRDSGQQPQNIRPDQKGFMRNWLENLGILKERTGGDSPIVIGNARADYLNHIDKMSRYVGLSEPVRNLIETLGNPEVRQTLREKVGQRWIDQMMDIAQNVSGTDYTGQGALLNASMKARAAIARGELGFRISSIMNHFLGGALEASEFKGYRDTREFFNQLLAPQNLFDRATAQKLEDLRPYFRDRYAHVPGELENPIARSMMDVIARSWAGRAVAKAGDIATLPITWSDKRIAVSAFKAWRESYMADHPGAPDPEADAWAAKQAEMTVRRTGTTSSPLDMTYAAMKLNRVPGLNLVTMFTSKLAKMRNVADEAIQTLKRDPSAQNSAHLVKVATLIAANAAAVAATRGMFQKFTQGPQTAKREENHKNDFLWEGLAELADVATLGGGTAVRSLHNLLNGRDVADSNIVSDTINRAAKDAVGSVEKKAAGKPGAAKQAISAMTGALKLLGVPLEAPVQYIEGLLDRGENSIGIVKRPHGARGASHFK